MEKLPVYEITFDPEVFESGVDAIAITEQPAIEMFGMRFHTKEIEIAPLYFADTEKKIIAGPAMIPNKPIYRRDGDDEYYVVFSRDTIEKMAAKFNSENRDYKFNIEHDDTVKVAGYLKENWIVEDSNQDKSSFYGFSVPPGTWFLVAQVTDTSLWETVIKEMDSVGFSIEGLLGIIPTSLSTVSNNKTAKMKKDVQKSPAKHRFFAKRISKKRKFNVKSKKFEDVLVSDVEEVLIVEEIAEGADVEILNEDAEVVTAPDGEYLIESEDIVIEVADGEIESIEPAVESTEMEEDEDEDEKEKEEDYQADPELIAKLIELESRLEALEAKSAEAEIDETAMSKFSKEDSATKRLTKLRTLVQ